jgi:hypothetical protein
MQHARTPARIAHNGGLLSQKAFKDAGLSSQKAFKDFDFHGLLSQKIKKSCPKPKKNENFS